MTGGGWIATNGGQGVFGFHVGFGFKGGCQFSVYVDYSDQHAGVRVATTSATSYGGTGNTRTFSGPATSNGKQVTYTITVVDNDGPGGHDSFSISLSNGYSASGVLGGGSIEIFT